MTEHEQRLPTDDLAGTRPQRREPEPAPRPTEMGESVESSERGAGSTRAYSVSAQAPLMTADEVEEYRWRWDAIQTQFVDAPRDAVVDADELVAEVMRHLAEVFARERGDLEASWERGEDVSTEDLRVSLRRYRSFFQRLLAT